MSTLEIIQKATDEELKELANEGEWLVCVSGYWSIPDFYHFGTFHPVPDDIQERLDKMFPEKRENEDLFL